LPFIQPIKSNRLVRDLFTLFFNKGTGFALDAHNAESSGQKQAFTPETLKNRTYMFQFQDISIKRKLRLIIMVASTVALLLVSAGFVTYELVTFRQTMTRDLSTLAEVIGNESTSALSFGDQDRAGEILGGLKAKKHIVAAALYEANGHLLAQYQPTNTAADSFPAKPEKAGSRVENNNLILFQEIHLQGDLVGTLYLKSDMEEMSDRLRRYAAIILLFMLASTVITYFLSSALQRVISRPVFHLAETARTVSVDKNYSVRATKHGNDELGQLIDGFNEMLSQIQERDVALNLSQQKMEALVNSIDGIVWERTPDRTRFTFVSRQSEDILGYEPQAWLAKPNFWEEKLEPQEAAKAIQTGHDLAARRQPYSYEYQMIAADGRTVWIRESGTVLVEKGQPVAMRGIFQDITRQKLNEKQLDKLNRQLMDNSRQAGMAEVATGVLHNVGNVLNSVSVSATLVVERLGRLKVENLRRATALLREQNGHLVEFLTTDPKGKVLPEYLVTVTDQLAGQQAKLIAQMSSVGQHIEHIKEIVAMQQNYAKVSGVCENLPAAGLVEDALRMNAAAFDRHHIEVVREFADNTPPMHVDRHKVLQILINLLRNAKYAMDAQIGHTKRLVVRVGMASPDRVKITIADNGIGIAPEHLTGIFNHGFTTKKDGHGFGLHSGANAAKEMGGTLIAHSDGPGKGAEFTLELPTTASAKQEELPATRSKI
jgi:PAS domain S-box-containing protein